MQTFVSAVCQAGVHGPGLVGAVEHFVKTLIHDDGQTLTTISRVTTQSCPAALGKLLECLLEPIGRFHFVVGGVELTTLLVTDSVQGEQHFRRELAAFFQHSSDGIGIDVRVGRQGFQNVRHMQNFIHHELHVSQWWGVLRHFDFLRLGCAVAQENLFKAMFGPVETFGRFQKPGLVMQSQNQAMYFKHHLRGIHVFVQVVFISGLHHSTVHR